VSGMSRLSVRRGEGKSIRFCGFPIINAEPSLYRAPPSTSTHPAVTTLVLEKKFRLFDKNDLPALQSAYSSSLWNDDPGEGEKMEWATECDVGTLVWMAMKDVSKEMGFDKMLKFVRELKKFSTKPDFFVFFQGPVGAVEVKKPGVGILNDASVLGEVFDQLMHLKNEGMVAAPFVLLSSYCEWRVCWLNDVESNLLAEKECSLHGDCGVSALHPEVATPQRAGKEISPESSPERHTEKVVLGDVSMRLSNYYI
jgi:hypothetical protein